VQMIVHAVIINKLSFEGSIPSTRDKFKK
jgi:hypothetical protein